MTTNSPFGKVNDAKAGINSEWVRAGRYLFYIRGFKSMVSRKQGNLAMFEMTTVLVLDNTAAAQEPKGPHRVGDHATWCIDLNKDAGPGTLKGALRDITDKPENEITAQLCELLSGPTQPLAGLFVEIDARVVPTREKKLPFTQVRVKRTWDKAECDKMIPAEVLSALGINTSRAV